MLEREIEALREHVSRLSVAVLRVNGSLDLDTVLEVVDSARVLTLGRAESRTRWAYPGAPRRHRWKRLLAHDQAIGC